MATPAPQNDPESPIRRAAREAVERASAAADGEELRELVAAELARLNGEFGDVDLLVEVHRALDYLQDQLYRRETRRRIETDSGHRRAVSLRLVREQLVGAGPADPRWQHEPPYRGLWPFQQDQSEVFYGRSRLTAELTGHVASCLNETGMAVVTGASGAGKSSLVRAGLIPAIAAGQLPVEGSEDWPVLTMNPGTAPIAELAARLSALTGTDAGSIRNTLTSRPGEAYLYARQAVFSHSDGMEPERRDRAREHGRLVLFVDQFEELFTLVRDDAARTAFVRALFSIASDGESASGVVVIGVRGDFIDRCAAIRAMVPVLRRHSFVVGPPEPDELRQVITGPAASAGLRLDSGLADDILADLRSASQGGAYTAGALPLLSQTMLSLWQRRDGDRLTRIGYNEIGGVGRAIEAGAEQVYQRLTGPQQALAAELFRRLTVIDRHGDVARRRARRSALLSELPGIDPVLEAFTTGRLTVMVGDSVEIAHDVLLRSWKRLDTWLQADRMHRALLTEVADDAAEWLDRGKNPSFLYQGAKLEAAEETREAWASNPDTYREWNSGVEAFLDSAHRAAGRRTLVRRAVAVALVALLAVSVTAAGVAFNANADLTAQRNRLLAEDLALASTEAAGQDGDLARLLAAAAWEIDPTDEHRDAMIAAVGDPVSHTATDHLDELNQLAFSPDGGILATSSADDSVIFWDTESREEVARLEGLNFPERISFHPDGGELVVQVADGFVVVDAERFTEREFIETSSGAKTVAYSPGGDHLVLQLPEAIRVWETSGYDMTAEWSSPEGAPFTGIGFDQEGRILVASETAVEAVDPATGERAERSTGGLGEIQGIGFDSSAGDYLILSDEGVWRSDDIETEAEPVWPNESSLDQRLSGRYLAEWSSDALTIVDLELGRPVRTMALSETIEELAIDPSETTIALAVDTELRYIEIEEMTEVPAFETDFRNPSDMFLAPDGARLAVTGEVGTRIWDLEGGQIESEPVFNRADLPGRQVQLHPNGDQVLITHAGSHRLFDIASGEEIEVPWDTEDWIAHVAFSPDGNRVEIIDGENLSEGTSVILELDPHASVLDADTGEEQIAVEPVNGEATINGEGPIAYSPDGEHVAAIAGSHIGVWAIDDGRLVAEVEGRFSAVSGVRFSGDSKRLAASGEEGPVVWDWESDELRYMDEPPSAGSFLSMNLGGSTYLTADGRHVFDVDGQRRKVRIWNADTGSFVTELTMTGGRLLYQFVPEHAELLGIDENGTVYRQDLAFLDDPHAAACAATDRELTEDEWDTYLPDLEYGELELCA